MSTHDAKPTPGLLYIDDEEKALKYFRMAFAQKYPIFTATSGEDGLAMLRQKPTAIGVILSDQRMPGLSGAEVLGAVREEFPHIVRILTTAYSDLDSAIQAVNKGHIYQYVVKPWEIVDLGMILQRAADYHQILTERNSLLAMKMTTLQRILCTDRLKWLLLSTRTKTEAEQSLLLRVLDGLIRALPESASTLSLEGMVFRAQNFEIESLLHREYHNAFQSLQTLDQAWAEVLPPEAAVRALGSTLENHLKLPAGQAKISGSENHFQITLPIPASQFVLVRSSLFGLLLSPTTPPASLALFRALLSLAKHEGSLVIANHGDKPATADKLAFHLPPDRSPVVDEIIDALAKRFSQWNISDR